MGYKRDISCICKYACRLFVLAFVHTCGSYIIIEASGIHKHDCNQICLNEVHVSPSVAISIESAS